MKNPADRFGHRAFIIVFLYGEYCYHVRLSRRQRGLRNVDRY